METVDRVMAVFLVVSTFTMGAFGLLLLIWVVQAVTR
jgi:hypothetical protein